MPPCPSRAFSEVLEIRNGKDQKKVQSPAGSYPIYGSGGVMGRATAFICPAETVVIGRKGSINNPIFVREPFWNVDTAFGLVARRDLLNPCYLFHFCRSFDFSKLNTTVTIPSLTKANLLKVQLPLPAMETQRAIAATLDKVCDLIAKRKDQLARLDELAKSLFVEMFGGDSFPINRLADLAEVSGGLTKNSQRKNHPFSLPYLRVANVLFNEFDLKDIAVIGLTEEEKKRTLLDRGDLLFVEGNGSMDQIGRVAVWNGDITPCVHQNHLIKARLNKTLLPVYAVSYFMSNAGRAQIQKAAVSTSGLHTLSISKVSGFSIPLPPLPLQQAFAERVEAIDKSKAAIRKSLEGLNKLYRSLLQQCFGSGA